MDIGWIEVETGWVGWGWTIPMERADPWMKGPAKCSLWLLDQAPAILVSVFRRLVGEGPVGGGGLQLPVPPDHVQKVERIEGRLQMDHPELEEIQKGIAKSRFNGHRASLASHRFSRPPATTVPLATRS